MSEKGSAKPHANSIDFTSRTSCQYAGREGLLSWTMITVTGNYTYPEQTPIWGIIRSVQGLSVTILRSDAVLDSWKYIVEQGAGRGDFVLNTTERLLIDARMPGVGTRQEPVAMELFGEKRPFLIVSNTKHKEYKMYISARDFGANLDVSWYFTAQPRFLKRILSKYATGNPQDMTMRVSLFAQQDVSAFKTITHNCVTRTLDGLLEELKLDPSSLNTGSKGFLSVW
jgi:hypothetical protein